MALLTQSYCRSMAPWARTRSLLAMKPQTSEDAPGINHVTPGINLVSPLLSVISRSMFWQRDRHGPGYSTLERRGRPLTEIETLKEGWNHAMEGLKLLPTEWAKWKEEKRLDLKGNRVLEAVWDYPDGTFQKEFEFRGRDSFSNWVVSTDRDWGEGFTKAELTLSKNNMALFQGHLCTDLPIDGKIQRAGYANIRSPPKRKSFARDARYNWSHFTHFIARVRGDGRTYVISLHSPGHYDITWNDTFNYYLFTRGGPYWQYVKIPFSRFFFGFQGSIQDKQIPLNKNEVSSIGFTVMDTYDGPFRLEIDYVGVLHEKTHNDTFEYEQYRVELAEF